MIRSMTGFGKHVGIWRDTSVSVEMRSVNHRFLEVAVRLPRAMAELEDGVRKAVQKRCRRGRVDISVALHGGRTGGKTLQLDRDLATQYHHALRQLKKTLRLGGTIDVAILAGFRDVFALTDEPVNLSEAHGLVLDLVNGALGQMERMRCREGEALAEDFSRHVERLRATARQIQEKAPHLAEESYSRMRARIQKLMGAEIPDQPRLLQELAVYADRCDISEELVRLESHMVQFERTLQSEDAVGKTLEFLLQEVGREINTIGSKANDITVAQMVVTMKAEVEKMREQVQNVE